MALDCISQSSTRNLQLLTAFLLRPACVSFRAVHVVLSNVKFDCAASASLRRAAVGCTGCFGGSRQPHIFLTEPPNFFFRFPLLCTQFIALPLKLALGEG